MKKFLLMSAKAAGALISGGGATKALVELGIPTDIAAAGVGLIAAVVVWFVKNHQAA